MLFQDAHGAVFLAMDVESNREVVLQRFFPFGAGEAGLEGDERVAYDQAIQNMKQLDHPHLRRVLDGGSDPVDGMPFVVTEARRGMSLQEYFSQSTLTVAQGRVLVESALELMIWLEERFGQAADWLALHPDDVEVTDEGNAFRFCVDPMKWLGLRRGPGAVKELVLLAEAGLGWTGRVVSGSTAGMLSGWLRMAKTRDLTVQEALVVLRGGHLPEPSTPAAVSTTVFAPLEQVVPGPAAYASSAMPMKAAGNVRWYVLGSVFCVALLALGAFVWLRFQHPQFVSTAVVSVKKKGGAESKKVPGAADDLASAVDEKKIRENVEKMARELQENRDSSEDLSASRKADSSKADQKNREHEPDHVRGIRKELGNEILMTEKVSNVRTSSSGKSVYIEFHGDGIAANRACGRYRSELGVAGMSVSELAYLKGKKVRLRGNVVEEAGTGRVMIDLTSPDQIEVLDEK
jgi:hypothetical protein